MTTLVYSKKVDFFNGGLHGFLKGDYNSQSPNAVAVTSKSHSLLLRGEDFEFGSNGVLKSGVITGFQLYTKGFGENIASIYEVNINAGSVIGASKAALEKVLQKLFTGDDQLYGHTGAETLLGYGGDDTFHASEGRDVYKGGSGFDTVQFPSFGGEEGVTLNLLKPKLSTGAAKGDVYESIEQFRGTNGDDLMIAGKQGVMLSGGALGVDTLVGGAGRDGFVFDARFNFEPDIVKGFDNKDLVYLSKDVFEAFDDFGTRITKANFVVGKAAKTEDQHIIYDRKTGNLFYDADGSGSFEDQVHFAVIQNRAALTASDFRLFDFE